jgi:hypothetical protein
MIDREGTAALVITAVRRILCFSVEPEGKKKLTRHGSVEIYDGKLLPQPALHCTALHCTALHCLLPQAPTS